MIRFLLRTFMWKTVGRLAGPKAAQNARKANRVLRLARRLGR